MRKAITIFIAGAILSAGSLGAVGVIKLNALNKTNDRLQLSLKKKSDQLTELKKSQAHLEKALTALKEEKEKQFDHRFGELVQAKENASWKALYQLGLKALNEKDFPRAYYALSEVHKNDPHFKQIKKHHASSKKAYAQHKKTLFEKELKATYLKAFDLQASNQFAQAQNNYQRVLQMRPAYKDAKQRLVSVSKQLDLIKKTRTMVQNNQWVAATYKLGFNHQANGRYTQAQNAYQQVLQYAPKYKDARRRLNAVKIQLAKHPPAPPRSTQTPPPTALTRVNCYQKGVEFGQCATSVDGSHCKGLSRTSGPPPECKNNPDFKKGLKSMITKGSQSMLKGFKF